MSDHFDVLPELRAQVNGWELDAAGQAFCTEACLLRYLRARDGNVAAAAKLLRKTIEWRASTSPEKINCDMCLRDPLSHSLRVVALDLNSRPVLYTCFSQASRRDSVADNVAHLLATLEQATALMERMGRGAESWIFITHFSGFGLVDANPKTSVETAKLLDHYPERLFQTVMVDAPALFSGTFSLVKPLLDARTKNKIHFVSSSKISAHFEGVLDPESISWLVREMKENADSKTHHKKRYWEAAAPHDPRAAPSFLKSDFYEPPPWIR